MTDLPSTPSCETPQETPPPLIPPARTYTSSESAFAWVCMVAGYLLCRLFPVTDAPLGEFLFVLGLFTATLIVLHIQKLTCPVTAWCAAGSAVAVSAALLISASPFLHRLSFWYALAAYAYFVYASSGNTLHCGASDLVLVDVFKAAVVMPFCAHANVFTALFSGKAKSGGKIVGKVLLGLLFALVPTVSVLTLLSYDSGFSDLLDQLFDFNVLDIFSHLMSIAFGIPIGMYLFGMLIADTDREGAQVLCESDCVEVAAKCRVMSPLTVAAATVPLLIVYAIFFVSQWQYYVAGFTGVLPDGFSYASFAREGFFQLCTVSVINLAMIVAAIAVTKPSGERPSVLLKILTPLYSVSTLVLIATAVAKMVMYIHTYGLTQKRVYATWFMAVIAVIFVLIAVGRFVPRMKTVFVCTAVCVVMFAGLSLCNVNGIIANHNVDRYLSGDLKTVDVNALEDLGNAAVPALCRLYDSDAVNQNLRTRVWEILGNAASDLNDTDLWSFNIPQLRAEHALKDIGILK